MPLAITIYAPGPMNPLQTTGISNGVLYAAEWPCCHDPLRLSPLLRRFVLGVYTPSALMICGSVELPPHSHSSNLPPHYRRCPCAFRGPARVVCIYLHSTMHARGFTWHSLRSVRSTALGSRCRPLGPAVHVNRHPRKRRDRARSRRSDETECVLVGHVVRPTWHVVHVALGRSRRSCPSTWHAPSSSRPRGTLVRRSVPPSA